MPLISVIVPTHNRGLYALSCIESVLQFSDIDLQLVVTDTSTDNYLFDHLHNPSCHFLTDLRFKYLKLDQPSNLTKNHNDALAVADGDYICVIGDDDCITGAAIDAARWARSRDIPVVSQSVTATYAWPDFRSRTARGGHASRLYVPRSAGKARWRHGQDDLHEALKRGFQGTDEMPRCYHGVVRRDVLEEIRNRTGAYFHGSSPDMSGAVGLACLVERYCEVDIPLTIPGVSGGSNSGRSAMNTHKGDLSSESQTSGFQQRGWTDGVPRFFSVETVWAHAGLATLEQLRPDLVAQFNYSRLLALCSIRHPEFGKQTTEALNQVDARFGLDSKSLVAREMRVDKFARFKYLARRIMLPTAANGRKYFGDITNVAQASMRYSQYAAEQGMALAPLVDKLD